MKPARAFFAARVRAAWLRAPRWTCLQAAATAAHTQTVAVLRHGSSPDFGPSYPLICILLRFLTCLGYTVMLPDLRDTLAHGAARGRSERVCVVLE